MSFKDCLKALTCLVRGHKWRDYFYPRTDGWFRGPHWRRECIRCGADEYKVGADEDAA